MATILPKSRVARKHSFNGEIHFIIPELMIDDGRETEDFDVVEIKKIMKKEAARPLLLLRAE
jgi:CRISPR/Cas system CMR-associated protein Cmr3 (group 5 of RAMP superfamily)